MADGGRRLDQAYKCAIARIHGKSNKVIGTGFLVDGGVITCAHVVRDALRLGRGQTPAQGSKVMISFPFSVSKRPISAEVKIYRYYKEEDQHREDVAGLILLEPLPERTSPIRRIEGYGLENSFRVYGFPEKRAAGREATGRFMTDLADGLVQIIGKDGFSIQAGFSGSAIWDEQVAAVVGMTVAVETEEQNSDIGFMVPALPLVEVQRKLECLVLEYLLTVDDEGLAAQINAATAQAYGLSCPDGWIVPDGIESKLIGLQDVQLAENEYEAIYRFAALLTQPELGLEQDLRDRIQQWVEPKVENFQNLLDQVQAQLADLSESQETDAESLLLITVKPVSGDEYPVQALFMPDVSQYQPEFGMGGQPVQAPKANKFGENVTADTLSSLVRACVAEVTQKAPQSLMIHLILPLDLIHQTCDRTIIEKAAYDFLPDVCIGMQYRFVVRIAERLEPQLWNLFSVNWQKKWTALQKLAAGKGCKVFIPGDSLDPKTALFSKLNHTDSLGLKLASVCNNASYRDIFGSVIAAGVPAAIWLRSDEFSDGLVAMDEIDGLLTCKIARLPQAIQQARSDAMAEAEDAHIGHHLSFLWDDPTLIPPSAHPNNQMSLGMK
ncbi:MAG: hypothetical protein AAGI45_07805 [Cyanobacteria bacterium P01_H01_bin.26]